MRPIRLSAIAFAVLVLSGCGSSPPTAMTLEARQQVDAVRKELAELRQQLEETRKKVEEAAKRPTEPVKAAPQSLADKLVGNWGVAEPKGHLRGLTMQATGRGSFAWMDESAKDTMIRPGKWELVGKTIKVSAFLKGSFDSTVTEVSSFAFEVISMTENEMVLRYETKRTAKGEPVMIEDKFVRQ